MHLILTVKLKHMLFQMIYCKFKKIDGAIVYDALELTLIPLVKQIHCKLIMLIKNQVMMSILKLM